MTSKTDRIRSFLDKANQHNDEALAAGANGRVEKNLHATLECLIEAVREATGTDVPASGEDTAPAKKAAAAKKPPAKKKA